MANISKNADGKWETSLPSVTGGSVELDTKDTYLDANIIVTTPKVPDAAVSGNIAITHELDIASANIVLYPDAGSVPGDESVWLDAACVLTNQTPSVSITEGYIYSNNQVSLAVSITEGYIYSNNQVSLAATESSTSHRSAYIEVYTGAFDTETIPIN